MEQALPLDFIPTFYDDSPTERALFYRVHRDLGGHWMGTWMSPNTPIEKKMRSKRAKSPDEEKAEHYAVTALRETTRRKEKKWRVVAQKVYHALLKDHGKDHDAALKETADKRTKAVISKYHKRWIRFVTKVANYDWSYFVTVTYDSERWNDEDAFRKSLNKCFSNLAVRRGWKMAGRYERGEEGDRLHYHALVMVPPGQMIGDLITDKSYSTKRKRWEETQLNTFFGDRFGRTEFQDLKTFDDLVSRARYIAKYMDKDPDEKTRYSRGIATEICLALRETSDVTMTYSGGDCVQAILLKDLISRDYINSYRMNTEKVLRHELQTETPYTLFTMAERLRRRAIGDMP